MKVVWRDQSPGIHYSTGSDFGECFCGKAVANSLAISSSITVMIFEYYTGMEQGWDPEVKKYFRKIWNLFLRIARWWAGDEGFIWVGYKNGKPLILLLFFIAGAMRFCLSLSVQNLDIELSIESNNGIKDAGKRSFCRHLWSGSKDLIGSLPEVDPAAVLHEYLAQFCWCVLIIVRNGVQWRNSGGRVSELILRMKKTGLLGVLECAGKRSLQRIRFLAEHLIPIYFSLPLDDMLPCIGKLQQTICYDGWLNVDEIRPTFPDLRNTVYNDPADRR